MTRESSIGREKARAILASLGRADEFDPDTDYYLATDADHREYLTEAGQDEPIARNTGTTSWASPGYPTIEA